MKIRLEFPTAEVKVELPIEALTEKVLRAIEQKLPVKISFEKDEKKEEPKNDRD